MKELLQAVKEAAAPCGYRKNGQSFWKTEQGFYRLINLQKGAYGDYFFVNLGLHPAGLPLLITGKLEVPERPREYQCILRQRLEKAVPEADFAKGLSASFHDPEMIRKTADAVPKIEEWFRRWASPETILEADMEQLSRMFTVVPILWNKAFWMLRCCCARMAGDREKAEISLRAYRNENREMDFSAVDRYLEGLFL